MQSMEIESNSNECGVQQSTVTRSAVLLSSAGLLLLLVGAALTQGNDAVGDEDILINGYFHDR